MIGSAGTCRTPSGDMVIFSACPGAYGSCAAF